MSAKLPGESARTRTFSARWYPLLSGGRPGLLTGLERSGSGRSRVAGGVQLTYGGKSLYPYGDEATSFDTGLRACAGNGNGATVSSPVREPPTS